MISGRLGDIWEMFGDMFHQQWEYDLWEMKGGRY